MTYFIELSVLVLVLAGIYVVYRNPLIGFVSLLAAEFIEIAFGLGNRLIGGVHLDPLDVVSICLLIAGALRTAQSLKTINATRLFAVGYVLLFAVSLARGFYSNGLFAAANESRSFVGPLIAALYFLTVPADDKSVRRYVSLYLAFGVALCLVAVAAAAGLPVGMTTWGSADASAVDGRYLPATGAAAIAVCGFLALARFRYWKRGMANQLLPMAFMAVAVYLRHRTVWIMMLAGAIVLLPLDARLFRRLLPAAALAAAVVAGLAFYGGSVQGLAGASQFSESATSSQTLEWRLNGWKDLLFDEEQNALTVSIGKSVGSGYVRIDPVSYELVAVAPHSEYVQEFLRVGIVGTFAILMLITRALLKIWRLSKFDPTAIYPSTSAWVVIILMTLVYGVTYGIEPHAYALLGIANAFLTRQYVPSAEHQLAMADGWEMEPVPAMGNR